MSLSIRIIPILLKRNGSLVKGKQFAAWRTVGHPLQAARIHAAREVDELMLLDIACRSPDLRMLDQLTREAFTPITIGGGISSLDDMDAVFAAGADKVCIKAKSFITAASNRYGVQAVCASLEIRDGDVVQQAIELENLGAGEILLQSVERDGMMAGYDLDAIEKVSHAVNIPIIASCGCGTYQHMIEAVQAGASAVAAGSMFAFTEATPLGAANYLREHGIKTRIH